MRDVRFRVTQYLFCNFQRHDTVWEVGPASLVDLVYLVSLVYLVGLVYFVDLVCLVCLVSLVFLVSLVDLVRLVCLVHFVCLVCLVFLVYSVCLVCLVDLVCLVCPPDWRRINLEIDSFPVIWGTSICKSVTHANVGSVRLVGSVWSVWIVRQTDGG